MLHHFSVFIHRFLLIATLAVAAQAQQPRASFFSGEKPLTAPSSRAAAAIARDYVASAASQMNISAQDLDSLFVAKQYITAHNGALTSCIGSSFKASTYLIPNGSRISTVTAAS